MVTTTEESQQDFDSLCHASICTIGTIESLYASIDSMDALQDSMTAREFAITKTVTWAPSISKREHISRYQMTFEEAQQTWILPDEKTKMMDRHVNDLKRQQQQGLPEGDDCTYRGLDALYSDKAERIRKTIGICVKSVLQEQRNQRGSKRVDRQQLAMVSASLSGGSTKSALNRAESDLQAATKVYQQMDTSSFFQELCAQNNSGSNSTPKRPVKQSPTTHFTNSGRPATTDRLKKTPNYVDLCLRGRWEVTRLLIANDANVNAKKNNEKTPLHMLCAGPKYIFSHRRKKIQLLIDNGADMEAKEDKLGFTPLFYASRRGDLEVIGQLIENGANPNAKDKFGSTPLHRGSGDMAWRLEVVGFSEAVLCG